MNIDFSPYNNIVKLCLQGMNYEENNKLEEASELFHEAWLEATNDFEKYIASYYVARHQKSISDKLTWLKTALNFALQIDNISVKSALTTLYFEIAKCYDDIDDLEMAKKNYDLSNYYKHISIDEGPFYHGTKVVLNIGDFLIAGGESNYKNSLKMNHIYFTALVNAAGLAAELAKGEAIGRVYIIEPTGEFENDPNVTDKKFPGNPTRSYRSLEPLKIVGEVTDWVRRTPEEINQWLEKLANKKDSIIN